MKRILTFALALLSVCSMVASCSGGDNGTTTVDNTTAADTTTAEAVETNYLDNYKGVDLGGAEFKFCVYSTEQYPNYLGEELDGEATNDAMYNRDKLIEQNYNVALSHTQYEASDKITEAVRQAVLSDEYLFDVVISQVTGAGLTTAASEGLLRSLTEIEDLDIDASWWSQTFNREFTINDNLFVTTGPSAFAYYYTPRLVAFNLRLAEEYNVNGLYDTVKDGAWTIDYMAETMKGVKADLDGDGKYGNDDLWGASVDEYSAAGFYISAGGTQTAVDADGKPYFLFDDEGNVDRLNKVASIIGNAELTQKAEEMIMLDGTYNIANKCYTFKNGNALYLGYGSQAIALYLRDMEDDYGILPVPKYDENQSDYINFGSGFSPAFHAVPITARDDEKIATVLNLTGYLSQRDLQPLVVDVLLKGKAARDENSIAMIDVIYKDVMLDFNSCYNFAESFVLVRDFTMGKIDNFASGWAAISSAAQAKMEEVYESYLK